MVIRQLSDLLNTKGSMLPVCDKPNITKTFIILVDEGVEGQAE